MNRQINIQITPYPEEIYINDLWGWGDVVQRPARAGQAGAVTDAICDICRGDGKLPRGDKCRACAGRGKREIVWAVRLTLKCDDHAGLARVGKFLDKVDRDRHTWQITIPMKEYSGSAGLTTVVCGLKGERLRPYHGTIWAHAALEVSYRAGKGTVRLVAVDRKARHHLGVEDTLLYTFERGDPITHSVETERPIKFPAAAAAAAMKRRKMLYAVEENA